MNKIPPLYIFKMIKEYNKNKKDDMKDPKIKEKDPKENDNGPYGDEDVIDDDY